MMKTLCGLLLISVSLTATNITSRVFDDVDNGWNSVALAKLYFHHSETQRQWAWELLGKYPLTGQEKILDFGCGDGKISAELSRLVKHGEVVGIDVSKKMIQWASTHFPHNAYSNLTFKTTESLILADIPGQHAYDIICALTVFHLVSNPLEILKNLKNHLNASGKLLITTPTGKSPALYQAANDIFYKYGLENPWKLLSQQQQLSMRTPEGCEYFLKEAGFRIVMLENADSENIFYDLDEFITWLIGTSTATWRIPEAIAPAFYADLVHRMHELTPEMIDDDGHIHFIMPRLHVIAELSHGNHL
jgi:trans-aconitate methyltransferase